MFMSMCVYVYVHVYGQADRAAGAYKGDIYKIVIYLDLEEAIALGDMLGYASVLGHWVVHYKAIAGPALPGIPFSVSSHTIYHTIHTHIHTNKHLSIPLSLYLRLNALTTDLL